MTLVLEGLFLRQFTTKRTKSFIPPGSVAESDLRIRGDGLGGGGGLKIRGSLPGPTPGSDTEVSLSRGLVL